MKCAGCDSEFFDGAHVVVKDSLPYHGACAHAAGKTQNVAKFLKVYPCLASLHGGCLEYLAEERINADPKHEFFVVTTTENNEYDLHSYPTQAALEQALVDMELEHEGGWMVDAVFVHGKRHGVVYNHVCTVKLEEMK